jgi:sulfite reductase (NADPH) hemoprotein beta-component
MDRMGVEAFKQEVEKRVGFPLQPAKPFKFKDRSDDFGWKQNHKGYWYFTAFIENGRVLDDINLPLKTAFLEIAQSRKANFRFTCNQNLIISDVADEDKQFVHDILDKYGIIAHTINASNVRKLSVACVALNTCPLALAEAQRYMPHLMTRIEGLMAKHGIAEQPIVIRMTGCPNGCARPYAAEIGFIGTSLGRYNLMLGSDVEGFRLNKLYKENLDEEAIVSELDHLFGRYVIERATGEPFGDFTMRKVFGITDYNYSI